MNVPEMTRKSVLATNKNGDFSRRVIDALFRLATMDWTRIFAVLRGTIYLPTTYSESAIFLLPMVWQQRTVLWGAWSLEQFSRRAHNAHLRCTTGNP